ncbi:hypothetical protein E0D86_19725 [Pseudomonas sp. IC_126]|uniref:hypothetical protein n=1 Tax=Pseudomonas sp. IC_126 TaxID=2547400 RepID=UPI00103ACECD|nr:hypothetical protein [Pseudomonas sp. IC_126]TCD18672.1 hypothetical protein E0D86_19725 [Pseudomonas sp. IC_126]
MSESDLVVFSVCRTRAGGIREGSSSLDASRWAQASILRQGIEALAHQSRLCPIDSTSISQIRQALKYLSESSAEMLNRSPTQLIERDIVAILHAMEADLSTNTKLTRESASKFSTALRRILTSGPDKLGDGNSLRGVVQEHFPRLRRRKRLPRNDLPSELALQRHVDWDDLVRQTHETLLNRQTAIEEAIAKEFYLYERIITQQNQWLAVPISQESRYKTVGWNRDKNKYLRAKPEPALLAAVLLQQLEQHKPATDSTGLPEGVYPVCSVATAIEGVSAYQFRNSSAPWFQARYRLPNPVMVAIFIALLIHTGWNQSAVGSLTLSDITPQPQGGYQLQGYKGKTDDDTPVVDVFPSSRLVCKAISLLLWNHQQLKALNLIAPSELRLWFGWQIDGFKYTINFADALRIKRFCISHNLDKFTASEIRPLRSALTYLPQRDLEAVRVLLGHKHLLVTDGYLQNTLFFRMNEANMLQFQRRIETSLTYLSGGEHLVTERKLNHSDIDQNLLFPTGDGGACIDPYCGHPEENLEPGEPCAGTLCQSGTGCPNYRLTVTERTLEMALRTLRYYQSRWSNLYHINQAAFSRLHIPRLLYIHVLLSIVHEQRPDLLRKAEEKLV